MTGRPQAGTVHADGVPEPVAWLTWGQAALLLAPFYLNDLANIFLRDAGWWLAQDYLDRLVVMGYLWHLVRCRRLPGIAWRATGISWLTILLWSAIAMAGGLLFIPGPGNALYDLFPATRLGLVPVIPPGWMEVMDLSAGLVLVAVSEELAFRGALQSRLAALFKSETTGLLAAAVCFGLIHWSSGVGSVLQTTLVGIVFGLCVRRARSLVPVIIAHYVADLLVYLQA